MILRNKLDHIRQALTRFPIVAIVGPRQVGKTTLARALAADLEEPSIYLDLELPSDLNKLQAAELYFRDNAASLIVIDEIQRMPELFPLLRAVVDQDRRPGRFLILGSAAPALIRQASESLAGRIEYHELSPLILAETAPADFRQLWCRGGYPESYLAPTDPASTSWREAFIATYLERDLPQLGIRVPAAQLRRFWTMIAHCHGQLWNASRIAAGMGLSPTAIRHYLDILQDTFIVRQLQPWHANVGKRLTKSPKVYLRDSGLLHTLLGLPNFDQLLAHPVVGSSFEGFVIEQLLASLPAGWEAYFYRTSAGAEIDLLLVNGNRPPIAVEVKYSAAPKPTKGFWLAFADLGCEKGYVVYPGNDRYPLGEGVVALPLGRIGDILAAEQAG